MGETRIYYFSGSGNSLHAAMEIAERIKPAKIISMRNDPAAVSADLFFRYTIGRCQSMHVSLLRGLK